MKHALFKGFVLPAAAIVAALGASFCEAQVLTTTNGPYYATPSWDQTLPAGTRFIVLSNLNSAAVLDRETGLVWQRTPSADTRNWFQALDFCRTLGIGGRAGWRLPSLSELGSLLDTAHVNPELPPGHPFEGVFFGNALNAGFDFYWSVTTDQLNPTSTLLINFGGPQAPGAPVVQLGSSDRTLSKTVLSSFRAWCVRSGQGPDTQ